MKKLIVNKIKCNECGSVIESKYTHDYRQCSCGKCAVDGGLLYARRNFAYDGVYEDLAEWEETENV